MRPTKPTKPEPKKGKYPHATTVNTGTLHIFNSVPFQPGIPTFGREKVWRSICNKITVPGVHKATQKELNQDNMCKICKRTYRPSIHDE